jgi:hypothetical protein
VIVTRAVIIVPAGAGFGGGFGAGIGIGGACLCGTDDGVVPSFSFSIDFRRFAFIVAVILILQR